MAEWRTVRIRASAHDHLERLAKERGCSKATAFSKLVEDVDGWCDVEVSADEARRMLAESAQAGSVPARIAYARLMCDPKPQAPVKKDSPLDELDELEAKRRGRV